MVFNFKEFPELSNSQLQFYYLISPHRQITETFNGHVTKVVDGDTIHVSTDFRDFDTVVRFANINALEMNAGGQESKSWLENQILNEDIQIVIDPENRTGKFGRIIGQIVHKGIDINSASLQAGQSKVF